MTYELITTRNLSKGLQEIPLYINDVSGGLFMKLVLASVWLICVFGSYFMQKKINNGVADFPGSLAVGGFVTIVVATLLMLIPGLVDSLTYVVILIIGGISVLYFLFSKNN